MASFGLLTVPCLLFAAIRLKSRSLALLTGGSALLLVGFIALSNPNSISWQETVSADLLMLLFGIGVVTAIVTCPLLLRKRDARRAARPRSKVS